jgi:glucose-6-phosphate-specific signal transduction histidine kinase
MDDFKPAYLFMILIGIISLLYHRRWNEGILAFQANAFKLKITNTKVLLIKTMTIIVSLGFIGLGLYDLIKY